jgi:hypothetical protein
MPAEGAGIELNAFNVKSITSADLLGFRMGALSPIPCDLR